MKKRICEAIDGRAHEIGKLANAIYKHPELGFKEYMTSDLVKSKFEELGLDHRSKLALTGIKARLPGSAEKPTIAILGEMDALICRDHPDADPITGAVHACGHNWQIASMLGAAIGLLDSGVMKDLYGTIALFAVPAEEYIDLDFRESLLKDGKIRFVTGKQELIRLGEFDDVDMAMMVHAMGIRERKAFCDSTTNGFIGKICRFEGRASHAGQAPHKGINALNAAALALMGIHAQREVFEEKEYVRIHGIIVKGGDSVNVVPSNVEMSLYVRAKTIEGIRGANEKVNRAIRAGAMAVGAEVEIRDLPPIMPLRQDINMSKLFKANVAQLVGVRNVISGGHSCGSTDMGDVTHIMPAIHPSIGGFGGSLHSKEFGVVDPEAAFVIPAKAMAMTVADLLWDKARLAKEIIRAFTSRGKKHPKTTAKS